MGHCKIIDLVLEKCSMTLYAIALDSPVTVKKSFDCHPPKMDIGIERNLAISGDAKVKPWYPLCFSEVTA